MAYMTACNNSSAHRNRNPCEANSPKLPKPLEVIKHFNSAKNCKKLRNCNLNVLGICDGRLNVQPQILLNVLFTKNEVNNN